MAKKQSGKKKWRVPETVLRLPDLDQAKSAVPDQVRPLTVSDVAGGMLFRVRSRADRLRSLRDPRWPCRY